VESRTFDRAVDYYDKTRGLPEDVMAKVIDMLVPELAGRNCVEIGVGTGRFAIPLAERGIPMTGIDLSEPMLASLLAKAPGVASACIADARQLPFRDATFSAGFVCHVFHLIPDWKRALEELRRVIGSGVIAHDFGHFGKGEWAAIVAHFLTEAGLSDRHVGANSAEEVDDGVRELGGNVRVLEPIHYERRSTFERTISELERGRFSITWPADDATRHAAAERTRKWVRAEFGDLGIERDVELQLDWRVYELR